jgi:hypothetical protein
MRIGAILCGSIVVAMCFGFPVDPGPHPASPSNARRFEGMFAAVEAVARARNIRYGFEAVGKDRDRAVVTLDLSDPSVGHILDDLVKQRPEYAWNLSAGVFKIVPRDPAAAVADVKIRSFNVQNANKSTCSDVLSRAPELRRWLTEHKAVRRELEAGGESDSGGRVTLDLQSVNISSVLDVLIRALGDSHWTIVHYGDKMQFVGIYF